MRSKFKMKIPEDFKTRLKIAKSKIKKQVESESEKKAHLWVAHSN